MKRSALRGPVCLVLALALALSLSGCLPGSSCPVSAPDWDEDGLHLALEQCVSYGSGEAGSSLKAVIAACGLLDWAEEHPEAPADSELTDSIEGWLGSQELAVREQFWENWPAIDQQAREIQADPEELDELLASAGDPQNHESYTLASYDRLCGCVSAFEGV